MKSGHLTMCILKKLGHLCGRKPRFFILLIFNYFLAFYFLFLLLINFINEWGRHFNTVSHVNHWESAGTVNISMDFFFVWINADFITWEQVQWHHWEQSVTRIMLDDCDIFRGSRLWPSQCCCPFWAIRRNWGVRYCDAICKPLSAWYWVQLVQPNFSADFWLRNFMFCQDNQ